MNLSQFRKELFIEINLSIRGSIVIIEHIYIIINMQLTFYYQNM